MLASRTVVSCVLVGLALAALATPARAHAQLDVGCYSWGACRDGMPFGMTPRPCSSGRDCDDPGVCVFESPGDTTGFCLVPTGMCEYCLMPEATTCPEAAIGSRGRQTPPLTIDGCAYAICGDSRYVVDGDTPDFPSLAPCFTGPFLNWWGGGDCDEDGIVNDLDRGEALCFANRPVTRVEEGRVTCEHGQFALDPVATRMCSVVSPDERVRACVEDGFLPFGICCTQLEECPTVPGFGVRCVRLPGESGEEGVCTYGSDVPPVDTSCLSATSGALCEDTEAPTAYLRWAQGNCDGDCDPFDADNASSDLVCGCRPDAGVDASSPDAAARPDADGVDASTLDAGRFDLDAGPPLDAAEVPTPSFGGSGVQCSVSRGAGPRDRERNRGAVLALSLAALVSWRRAARSRGARSRTGAGSRTCS